MKLAIVLLLIGAVAGAPTAAPSPNGALIVTLEKRASALHASVKKVLAEHQAEHGHLLQALEHQEAQVGKLAAQLAKLVAEHDRVHQLHQIHVLEEELLFLENRVISFTFGLLG